MSIWAENPDTILSICEEVLSKTEKMHEQLKHNYIVVFDDGCVNAYNYFLLPFEDIISLYKETEKRGGPVILSSDILYRIIYHDYKVNSIIKLTKSEEAIGTIPTIIYSKEANGEQIFTIDRENKTVYKPSAATYVDTPFDIMLTIVFNGLRAILGFLTYVTNDEILDYAMNLRDTSIGRPSEIASRLIEIIQEKMNGK